MKKIGLLTIVLACLGLFFTPTTADAQCQCPYNNVQFGTSNAPTTSSFTTLTTCIFGGEYRRVNNLIPGASYTVQTCGDFSFDTQLSLYPAGGGTCFAGNDDFCGLQSQVTFTATTTSIDILVDQFFCTSNTSCMTIRMRRNTSLPGPANDVCTGAETINCGDTKTGNTAAANADVQGFCGTSNGTGGGVWYEFTGTGDCIEATTCNPGSNYDTKLRVWSGSCGALTCVTGNDDATCSFSFLRSTVNWVSTPGTSYFILVHGFASSQGNFELSLTCSAPPSNDNVCGASFVNVSNTVGATVSVGYDNSCAGAQAGEVSPGAGTGPSSCNSQDGWCSFETGVQNSLWYSFVAPASGEVIITALGQDSQLALWQTDDCQDFGSFVEVAANDDSGPGLAAQIGDVCFPSLGLTPGEEYWIQVDGFSGSFTTNGTLTIQTVDPNPIANEDPCGALPANVGGCTPFDNQCAQSGFISPGAGSNSCNSQDGWCSFETNATNDVWYSFTAPSSSVTITSGPGDTQLAIWQADDCQDPGSFALIGANDDSGPVFASAITLNCLTTGQEYLVQIDGFANSTQSGDLCITDNGVPDLEVSASCATVYVGYTPEYNEGEICASILGGTAPYTISWSNGASSACQTVSPSVSTCYTVTVTDANGCVATADAAVQAIDVSCGPPNNPTPKVLVCHLPPGNPANAHNICIGFPAVNDHLALHTNGGGDFLGPCDQESCEAVADDICGGNKASAGTVEPTIMLNAYPNPFNSVATVEFQLVNNDNAVVEVFDVTGNKVATLFNGAAAAYQTYKLDLNGDDLADGMYIYKLSTESGQVEVGKIYLMK